MSSSSAEIFFDGASKGNHGILGVGGLVFSIDRSIKFSFSWGLGTMSKNQAESYGLLLASQFAQEKGYKSIQIFGDSELLIKGLNSTDIFNNFALNSIMQRIRNVLKDFDKVTYFHVLQDLNDLADALTNKACLLAQGTLCIIGESIYFHPIP